VSLILDVLVFVELEEMRRMKRSANVPKTLTKKPSAV